MYQIRPCKYGCQKPYFEVKNKTQSNIDIIQHRTNQRIGEKLAMTNVFDISQNNQQTYQIRVAQLTETGN